MKVIPICRELFHPSPLPVHSQMIPMQVLGDGDTHKQHGEESKGEGEISKNCHPIAHAEVLSCVLWARSLSCRKLLLPMISCPMAKLYGKAQTIITCLNLLQKTASLKENCPETGFGWSLSESYVQLVMVVLWIKNKIKLQVPRYCLLTYSWDELW